MLEDVTLKIIIKKTKLVHHLKFALFGAPNKIFDNLKMFNIFV